MCNWAVYSQVAMSCDEKQCHSGMTNASWCITKSQFTAAASDVAEYLPCHSKRKSLKQKKKKNTMLICAWFFFESTGQLVWNTFQLCSKILPTLEIELRFFWFNFQDIWKLQMSVFIMLQIALDFEIIRNI